MPGIRTLKLLWERRLRGAYPVSRYALCNDGSLAIAVPRPLEPRSYDVTRLTLDSAAEIRSSFAAETLLKLEVSGHAASCVGMTADDLYLFHSGDKRRFLAERHLLYIDVSVSEDVRHLVVIFSDLAAASYALAYGEVQGRVVWVRDMDLPVTTAVLSRFGNRIAVGTDSGSILLIDSSRRDVWEFGQSEPVCSLACSEDGVYVAYGTALGGVGLVDGAGTRRWEARLPGEVNSLALSNDGRLCAALCSPEGDPGATRLFCIEETGRIGWEYDAEQPLAGLTLSAEAKYLAVSSRTGVLSVYEIILGEAAAPGAETALMEPLSRADDLAEAGDIPAACKVLETALGADPGDVTVYQRLVVLRERRKFAALECAAGQTAQADYAAAMHTLETANSDAPLDHDIVSALLDIRRRYAEQLVAKAQADDEIGIDAQETLLAALEIDPTLIEARRVLGKVRIDRVRAADLDAARELAAGNVEAAVCALERAQALMPSAQRKERLHLAYIAMEFDAGMAAYNGKRYLEALFQFKKALHRDPSHPDARRYLAYAEKFAQDELSDHLTDRFSYLE